MKDTRFLEARITEAVDGLLNEQQLTMLEADLRNNPELLAEYQLQMTGLPVQTSYTDVMPDPFAVSRLRQKMRATNQDQWQYDAIGIFKRYVLASGLGVILFLVALHAIPTRTGETDPIVDEITIMFESMEQDALSWSTPDNTPPSK